MRVDHDGADGYPVLQSATELRGGCDGQCEVRQAQSDALTLDDVAGILHQKFDSDDGIDICLVYGSFAKGRAGEASDVDVAIRSPGGVISTDRLVEMQLDLSDAFHREVDLADLSRAEGLFLYEIMTSGVRVKFAVEPYSRLLMEALYWYEDFLPIRRRVQEAVLQRAFYGK